MLLMALGFLRHEAYGVRLKEAIKQHVLTGAGLRSLGKAQTLLQCNLKNFRTSMKNLLVRFSSINVTT